jgi:putative glutamine amidotransferase
MKKILVSQRLIQDSKTQEIRAALDVAWASIFKQLDVLPIPVAYDVNLDSYFKIDGIVGVLLTGGNDLNHLAPDSLNEKRDNLERNLLQKALTHKLPCIGICRGAEFIAHYFGGVIAPVTDHVKPQHSLQLTDAGNYLGQFFPLNFVVNSFHNFGIIKLGPEFKALALHQDQTIEAFASDKMPILGIMWHPERNPIQNETINLLKNFWKLP